MRNPFRPIRYRHAVAILAAVAGAACADGATRSEREQASADGSASDAALMSGKVAGGRANAVSEARAPDQPGPPLPPPSPVPPQGGGVITMIIRTASASIRVDSLEPAIAAVQRIASTLGGIVGNTTLSSGDYQVRSATIELRIPAERFNEAIEGLRPLGKVESITTNAQDVSEEFVDVSARVANAKRLEERLIALLANRTGKLEEVLAVERELARVREEIERYEGRIRFLQTRVATSTLTVTVHEREPLVSNTPGRNVIVEAFKQAWRNFVTFVAMLIASLGVVIPIGIVVGAILLLVRRLRRRGT